MRISSLVWQIRNAGSWPQLPITAIFPWLPVMISMNVHIKRPKLVQLYEVKIKECIKNTREMDSNCSFCSTVMWPTSMICNKKDSAKSHQDSHIPSFYIWLWKEWQSRIHAVFNLGHLVDFRLYVKYMENLLKGFEQESDLLFETFTRTAI